MELENVLKDILKASIENSEIAGANFLVVKDGKEVVYVQKGMADREAGRKIERDTIFRLYSQTKPVISVAAMILMERGLLDFYAPVSEFLPSFAQMYVAKGGERVPCTRQILVNDLLNMTSGLVYPDEGTEAGRAADKVFQEAGGAGLASTLDDYSRFAAMLLNEGSLDGVHILKPKTVEFFRSGELLPAQQDLFRNWVGLEGYSYGNLMRVCKNPSQSGMMTRKGEYGWDGWLGMYFANFPEEKMTILMGTQKRNGGTFGLTRKLRNVVLSRV